ncbi:uncharacterized protein LOC120630732 [Pararge aegeria]|uniref:Jg6887 protein n=1 Tax=Pararge aegeria aegeria TaxID=348720 RepID=A0A8S4RQ14_9NEOP|nr:uncharacterized protein LOC120630732 [Pararge aegeria]CAH2239329.1 jg6887 [Pararge aegeria aegeria]
MGTLKFLFLLILIRNIQTNEESDEPILYYYGLEESERSLPTCSAQQACSALVQRYWRRSALVRLCRCGQKLRCDELAPPERRIELNNRDHLQFCQPVTQWRECSVNEIPLAVETAYDRMNPDELEELHHENIQLTPPRITLECRCRSPNYWRLNRDSTGNDDVTTYQCTSLPLCKSGDFCGNVNDNHLSLYQSCLCPRNHICVHNGGISHIQISELLYRGKGWRAYCQPVSDDYLDDDY